MNPELDTLYQQLVDNNLVKTEDYSLEEFGQWISQEGNSQIVYDQLSGNNLIQAEDYSLEEFSQWLGLGQQNSTPISATPLGTTEEVQQVQDQVDQVSQSTQNVVNQVEAQNPNSTVVGMDYIGQGEISKPRINKGAEIVEGSVFSTDAKVLQEQIGETEEMKTLEEETGGFFNTAADFISGFFPEALEAPIGSPIGNIQLRSKRNRALREGLTKKAKEKVFSGLDQAPQAVDFDAQFQSNRSSDDDNIVRKTVLELDDHLSTLNDYNQFAFEKLSPEDKQKAITILDSEQELLPSDTVSPELQNFLQADANLKEQKQNIQTYKGDYPKLANDISNALNAGRDAELSPEQLKQSVFDVIDANDNVKQEVKDLFKNELPEIGDNSLLGRAITNTSINLGESVEAIGDWVSGVFSNTKDTTTEQGLQEAEVSSILKSYKDTFRAITTQGSTKSQGSSFEYTITDKGTGTVFATQNGKIVGVRGSDETLQPIKEGTAEEIFLTKYNSGKLDPSFYEKGTNFRGLALLETGVKTSTDMAVIIGSSAGAGALARATGVAQKGAQAATTTGTVLGVNATMFGSLYNAALEDPSVTKETAGLSAALTATAIGLSESVFGAEAQAVKALSGEAKTAARSAIIQDVKNVVTKEGVEGFVRAGGAKEIVKRNLLPILQSTGKGIGSEQLEELIIEPLIGNVVNTALGQDVQISTFEENFNTALATIVASGPISAASSLGERNQYSSDEFLIAASQDLETYDEIVNQLVEENPDQAGQISETAAKKREILVSIASKENFLNEYGSQLSSKAQGVVAKIHDTITDSLGKAATTNNDKKQNKANQTVKQYDNYLDNLVSALEKDYESPIEGVKKDEIVYQDGDFYQVDNIDKDTGNFELRSLSDGSKKNKKKLTNQNNSSTELNAGADAPIVTQSGSIADGNFATANGTEQGRQVTPEGEAGVTASDNTTTNQNVNAQTQSTQTQEAKTQPTQVQQTNTGQEANAQPVLETNETTGAEVLNSDVQAPQNSDVDLDPTQVENVANLDLPTAKKEVSDTNTKVAEQETQIKSQFTAANIESNDNIDFEPKVGEDVAIDDSDYRLAEDGEYYKINTKTGEPTKQKLSKAKKADLQTQVDNGKALAPILERLSNGDSPIQVLNDLETELGRPLTEADLPPQVKNRKEIIDTFNDRKANIARRNELQDQISNSANEQVQNTTSTTTGSNTTPTQGVSNQQTRSTSTEPSGSAQSSTDGNSNTNTNQNTITDEKTQEKQENKSKPTKERSTDKSKQEGKEEEEIANYRLTNKEIDKVLGDLGKEGLIDPKRTSSKEALNIANQKGYLSPNLEAETLIMEKVFSDGAVNEYEAMAVMKALGQLSNEASLIQAEITTILEVNPEENVTYLLNRIQDIENTYELFAHAHKKIGTTGGRTLAYRFLSRVDDFVPEKVKKNIRNKFTNLTEKELENIDKIVDKINTKKQELLESVDEGGLKEEDKIFKEAAIALKQIKVTTIPITVTRIRLSQQADKFLEKARKRQQKLRKNLSSGINPEMILVLKDYALYGLYKTAGSVVQAKKIYDDLVAGNKEHLDYWKELVNSDAIQKQITKIKKATFTAEDLMKEYFTDKGSSIDDKAVVILAYIKSKVKDNPKLNLDQVIDITLGEYNKIEDKNENLDLVSDDIITALSSSTKANKKKVVSEYQKNIRDLRKLANRHIKIDKILNGDIKKAEKGDKPTDVNILKELDSSITTLARAYINDGFSLDPVELEAIVNSLFKVKSLYQDAFFNEGGINQDKLQELKDHVENIKQDKYVRRLENQLRDIVENKKLPITRVYKKTVQDEKTFKLKSQIKLERENLVRAEHEAEVVDDIRKRYPKFKGVQNAVYNWKVFKEGFYEFPRRYVFGGDVSMLLIQGGYQFHNTVGSLVNPMNLFSKTQREQTTNNLTGLKESWKVAMQAVWKGVIENDQQYSIDLYEDIVFSNDGAFAKQMGLKLDRPFVENSGISKDDFFAGRGISDFKSDNKFINGFLKEGVGRFDTLSEGSYVSFLNVLRMNMFKTFVNSNPNATVEQYKEYAKMVNANTGSAGNLGVALSKLLAAPRLYWSRLVTLASTPKYLARMVKNPRDPVAKQILLNNAQAITGFAMMGLGFAMMGWDFEEDPRSSNFLKFVKGDEAIDASAGFAKFIKVPIKSAVYLDRESGIDLTSKVLGPEKKSQNTKTGVKPMDQIMNMGKYSLHPFIGRSVDLFTGENVIGQPFGTTYPEMAYNLFISTMTPLAVQDALKVQSELIERESPLDKAASKSLQSAIQESGINYVDYENNIKHKLVLDHLDSIDYNPSTTFTKTQIVKIFPELDQKSLKNRAVLKTYRKEVQDAVGTRILEILQNGGIPPSKDRIKDIFAEEARRVGVVYRDHYGLDMK